MKMKRWLSLLLALCMMLAVLPVTVSAAEIVDSGTCGDNLTWTFDSDGTLTISGTGDMANYLAEDSRDVAAPWAEADVKSVVVEDGVTSIGTKAFLGCTSLTSVVLADSVTTIHSGAFDGCTALQSVKMPAGLTMLGDCVFYNCASLKEIEIPDGVAILDVENFANCTSLEKVFIGAGMEEVSCDAFANCTSLKSIIFEGDKPYFVGDFSVPVVVYYPAIIVSWGGAGQESNGVVTYTGYQPGETPWDVGIIDSGSCGEDVTWTLDSEDTLIISGTGPMDDSVVGADDTNIPWEAYSGTITSIVISDGITHIGDNSFFGCTNMTKVEIPDSVTSIGVNAFGACFSLESVTLPETLTSIGASAFSHSGVKTIDIPDSVTSIGASAFSYSALTSVKLPKGITSISDGMFDASALESIELYEGITHIGEMAFHWCGNLKNITLPSTLETMGDYAFESTGLESITIPGSVKNIGNAFWGSDVTSVTICDGVETIGSYSFGSCFKLQKVIIPASVKSIGACAFNYNADGAEYYFMGDAPQCETFVFGGGEIAESFFSYVTGTAYYPAGNETWTEEVRAKRGGVDITWVSYEPEDSKPVEPSEPIEPAVKNGIVSENGGKYYYVDNVLTYAGLIKIDGDYYYVRSSGEVVCDRDYWITNTNGLLPAASYTFGADGKMVNPPVVGDTSLNGIVDENGVKYYYVDGVRTGAGLIKLDGDYYYVRSNGEVVCGRDYWATNTNGLLPAAYYTFGADGKMVNPPDVSVNGIVDENGAKYYYVNGVRTGAGLIKLDGDYYYVRSSGEVVCGRDYWATNTNGLLPAAYYTFGADGKLVNPPDASINGIVDENGAKYYYVNGVRTGAGLVKLDGDYYYVRSSGEVVCGQDYWITNHNGLLPAGYYTFGADGKMVNPPAAGEAALNGIVSEGGKKYYYVDGVRTGAGLIQIDGDYYYVRSSGEVVCGQSYWTTNHNGLLPAALYTFDADGKMVN